MKNTIYPLLFAGIFLCSCASDPCKDKQVTLPVIKYRTVENLDSLKKSDTVLVVLNGRSYKITSAEAGFEKDTAAGSGPKMLMAGKPNKPCDSESFDGSDRKAAKISIATGKAITYSTLADFIQSLPSDADMAALNISSGPTSNRITQEKKNVHILKAYIYTYTRESDEDYHVILGTTDKKSTATFFNMEISGLPPSSAKAYSKLKSTRDAFTAYFKINGCASGYAPIFNPPVEAEVSGSIFFDALHFLHHNTIGPKGYNPKSYWEIHPATEIVFK